MYKWIFNACIVIVFFANISFVKLYVDPTYLGWLLNATYIIGIGTLLPLVYQKGKTSEWIYFGALILGFFFHLLVPEIDKNLNDSFKWIFMVLLLIAHRKINTSKIIFYLMILFFFVHSGIAIYEKLNLIHLFNYSFFEEFGKSDLSTEFRSFGLMEHPLYSANVLVIIMAFLLLSKRLPLIIKIIFILIGSYALISFNSRAALLVWILILLYRVFLYKRPIYLGIILGVSVVLIFFLNDLSSVLFHDIDIFGRLSGENAFKDDSSMTRVLSFVFFWNESWSIQDIFLGGRIIYMPGSELSLENGVLLTIGWWGWIVGLIKVIFEMIISYNILTNFNSKERIILLLATWGVAFANNNSINTFVFAFFIISFLAVSSFDNYRDKVFVRSKQAYRP